MSNNNNFKLLPPNNNNFKLLSPNNNNVQPSKKGVIIGVIIFVLSVIITLGVHFGWFAKKTEDSGVPGDVKDVKVSTGAENSNKYTIQPTVPGLLIKFKSPSTTGITGSSKFTKYLINLRKVGGDQSFTWLLRGEYIAGESVPDKYEWLVPPGNGVDANTDSELFIYSGNSGDLKVLEEASYTIGIKAVNENNKASPSETLSEHIIYDKCKAGETGACNWGTGSVMGGGPVYAVLEPDPITSAATAGGAFIGNTAVGAPCSGPDSETLYSLNAAGTCVAAACKTASFALVNGLCTFQAQPGFDCIPTDIPGANRSDYKLYNIGNNQLVCDLKTNPVHSRITCEIIKGVAAQNGTYGAKPGCAITCNSNFKPNAQGTCNAKTCAADMTPTIPPGNGTWGGIWGACVPVCNSTHKAAGTTCMAKTCVNDQADDSLAIGWSGTWGECKRATFPYVSITCSGGNVKCYLLFGKDGNVYKKSYNNSPAVSPIILIGTYAAFFKESVVTNSNIKFVIQDVSATGDDILYVFYIVAGGLFYKAYTYDVTPTVAPSTVFNASPPPVLLATTEWGFGILNGTAFPITGAYRTASTNRDYYFIYANTTTQNWKQKPRGSAIGPLQNSLFNNAFLPTDKIECLVFNHVSTMWIAFGRSADNELRIWQWAYGVNSFTKNQTDLTLFYTI